MKATASKLFVIGSAILLVSCSQGDATRMASPSSLVSTSAAASDNGVLGITADGDVKSGSGALEFFNLRMDRQTSAGASVFRQYANPGGSYVFETGETIELWAEYRGADNPRFKVQWGDGTDDMINCGSCLIKHTYRNPGAYAVVAMLDDRVSTTVTRRFTLRTESDTTCSGPASVSSFNEYVNGDEEDGDFDGATTRTFGPVFGANTLSFSCDGCYAHSHDEEEEDSVLVKVEVHNPQTGGWTTVYTRTLGGEAEDNFSGKTFTFATRQAVDRIRLSSDPGQDWTFHNWNPFTITATCGPDKK